MGGVGYCTSPALFTSPYPLAAAQHVIIEPGPRQTNMGKQSTRNELSGHAAGSSVLRCGKMVWSELR